MSQIGFFDGGKRFKIDKPVRLIELFAGNSIVVNVLEKIFENLI